MKLAGLLVCLCICFTLYGRGMAGDECGCGVRHPQVRYCNSTMAMLVQIHDKEETDLPFSKENSYKNYMRFNITILEVFKPKELEASLINEEYTSLWTVTQFCGIPELDIMETYVITGHMQTVTDPETGESISLFMMTRCGLHLKMDDVTDYQMRGLTGEYEQQCHQCKPNPIFGELTHRRSGVMDARLFPEAITHYWTLDMECFYNPVASMHNLVRDCESQFSVCLRDPETSKCMWDLNMDYLECFKKRGMSIAYKRNRPAVRRPSDCKYLQSKKLKKKCLRDFRKKYKSKKRQRKLIVPQ